MLWTVSTLHSGVGDVGICKVESSESNCTEYGIELIPGSCVDQAWIKGKGWERLQQRYRGRGYNICLKQESLFLNYSTDSS